MDSKYRNKNHPIKYDILWHLDIPLLAKKLADSNIDKTKTRYLVRISTNPNEFNNWEKPISAKYIINRAVKIQDKYLFFVIS